MKNIKSAIFDMDGTLVDSLMLWDIIWKKFGVKFLNDDSFRPRTEDDKAVRTLTLKDAMAHIHKVYNIGKSGEELLCEANAIMRNFYANEVTLTLTLEDRATTLGTTTGHFFNNRLGALTLRETGASKELTEAADLNDHVSATFITFLLGDFVRHFDPGPLQSRLCFLHLLVEIPVKAFQHIAPVALAGFHIIQLILHMRGEFHIDDILETLYHQSGYDLPQCRWG